MQEVTEQILRAALSNAGAAVAVFTDYRRVVTVNDRYLALTGYSREEALEHRAGENLRLDPLDQDEFLELITSGISTGETDIVLKNGESLAIEFVVIPTQIEGQSYFIGLMLPLVAGPSRRLPGVARTERLHVRLESLQVGLDSLQQLGQM
jgi:PAS domain S-box-containing protein